MSKLDLGGKTAVITGAGSGIGRGLAQVLSGRGCRLALSDVDSRGLEETVSLLNADVFSEVVDVADREAVFAHADAVRQRFGEVDLVINNAGVDVAQSVAEINFEDFHWLMDINFWGVVHGTKAFLPGMLERDSGAVVNISSIFGVVAWPGQSSYCAAKFAVRGFTEALRHELEGSGVRAITVHPGAVNTNIVRSSRYYASRETPSHDEMVEEFARVARTHPEQAAETIVRGIEAGRERILPGDGARLLDWVQRLRPVAYYRLLSKRGPFGNGKQRKRQAEVADS